MPTNRDVSTKQRRFYLAVLAFLAIVQLLIYIALNRLSNQFAFESSVTERPLLLVVFLFFLAFLAYLVSLLTAIRMRETKQLMWVILFLAVAFRIVMLPSQPIQEVDIYRYIWDGAVANEGVSPYRYPPDQIRVALAKKAGTNQAEISQLADMVASDSGLREVLRRVHFRELPTVYPPVSQAVFRFSDALTPAGTDAMGRVFAMKTVIVLFDIGVVLLLWLLLRLRRMHSAWCIAYGWSPLVIKEFANSGHLDSIAVFLMMAAIVVCTIRPTTRVTVTSSALLGLAFGAKLFPVVIAPALAAFVWKRQGWRSSMIWCAGFLTVSIVSVAPMVNVRYYAPSDQVDGLKMFLTHWEINDLIFMVVEENLRPENSISGQPPLWFAVTPNCFRTSLAATSFAWTGDEQRTPFLLTRAILLAVFGMIVYGLCRRTMRDADAFLGSAFMSIAWFWFLSPTQNPWYWTWGLPLIPFVRNRVWLLVSGLAMIYYVRFWFEYHGTETSAWTSRYQGVAFFDFVVVWIEFAPFLIALGLSGMCALRVLRR